MCKDKAMKYTLCFQTLQGRKLSLVILALIAGATIANASPSGGTVTSGSATINQSGSVTTINQSTNRASINWQNFSIGASETVNFAQPSSSSVTLNRVVGTSQSLIEGAMNANGQVLLLNPNGVLFANGSQINVGRLAVSTLNMTDENFQSGNYAFEGNFQNSIRTMQTMIATMEKPQFSSGEKISLNLNGNSLVKLTIDQGVLNALAENKGLTQADGGRIYLTPQALNSILDGIVNNTGIVEAQTLNDLAGRSIEASGKKIKNTENMNSQSNTAVSGATPSIKINTNIGALNIQQALQRNSLDLSSAMERLSTGLRLESIADDALER